MSIIDKLGDIATKAAEIISAVKVMETKLEALDRQFMRLDSSNQQFMERVRIDLDNLHCQIAKLNGISDARNARLDEVSQNIVQLRSFIELSTHIDLRTIDKTKSICEIDTVANEDIVVTHPPLPKHVKNLEKANPLDK